MHIELVHPMIVHFPIVLALTALGADVVALARANKTEGVADLRIGTVLFSLGAIGAALAYVFGDIAYDVAVDKGVAQSALETHEGWGTTTAIIFGIVAVLRLFLWWRGLDARRSGMLVTIGSTAVVALLVLTTAYFGGELVYDLGVNVAPHA